MLLVVGKIIRPHGLRGEVVVDVRTAEPSARFAPVSVLAADSGGPGVAAELTVETARPHQGRMLVVFDGVYERDLAERSRGVELCIDSADVPPSDDPDEFNDHQLVGLAAVTQDG